MRQPVKPRPIKTAEENRRRSSAFRSASPLIKTARQHRAPSPVTQLAQKKVKVGAGYSLTWGAILVICALFVILVGPPLFNLVSQYEQRNKVRGQLQSAQSENQKLREELQLWEDSDYLSEQARKRLGYVKPGETRFAVSDPGPDYQNPQDQYHLEVPARPWFLEIVNSDRLAGLKEGTIREDTRTGKEVSPAPGATTQTEKPKGH